TSRTAPRTAPPRTAPPPPPKPTPLNTNTYRSSSPLSPKRITLPGRPVFPRSKQEPDLYKMAIIARMRCTPEGQRILHMGPKLAFSIMSATKELERLVAAQPEENDVVMSDSAAAAALSASWVVVPQDRERHAAPQGFAGMPTQDWEMVDCGA
ncbi:hypothetical protein BDP27DRAFT_1330400, partial [Rhodocollybia butyracea]